MDKIFFKDGHIGILRVVKVEKNEKQNACFMIIFDQTAAGSTGQSTVQQPGIFILSHLTDEEKMMVIYLKK